jgi:DNA-binding GntR family transcriptional regulator
MPEKIVVESNRWVSASVPRTAKMEVYDAIKQRILNAVYLPHEFIREARVAQELKVSRTPVREAFRELISEGWLEAIPHQGARVSAWTERDAREVFEIRLVLEPMAVALACNKMDRSRLDHLNHLASQMETLTAKVEIHAEFRNSIAALNHEFHKELIAGSDNYRLMTTLENIVRSSVIRRNFTNYKPEHLQRSMRHHREILDAIESRNGGWAESIMRSHLLAAYDLHINVSDLENRHQHAEDT